jgi:hypothetical protein
MIATAVALSPADPATEHSTFMSMFRPSEASGYTIFWSMSIKFACATITWG